MHLVSASLYIENTERYSNFELYVYVNGTKYKLMNQFRMPTLPITVIMSLMQLLLDLLQFRLMQEIMLKFMFMLVIPGM